MHTTFRTLGQQMGMQLIRAILPESIDVFINEVINEKVRNVVMNNVATQFNDRVAIQDNSISPINSIRTLSKREPLTIGLPSTGEEYYAIDMDIDRVMFYTSFSVKYATKGTYGARFIESDKVDDTRRDYCNRESWDAPIVTMLSNEQNEEYVRLYTDNISKIPVSLEVGYIKLPVKVKWSNDVNTSINCDLPEYIHNEIVELAVDKYFRSVGATTKPVTRN